MKKLIALFFLMLCTGVVLAQTSTPIPWSEFWKNYPMPTLVVSPTPSPTVYPRPPTPTPTP